MIINSALSWHNDVYRNWCQELLWTMQPVSKWYWGYYGAWAQWRPYRNFCEQGYLSAKRHSSIKSHYVEKCDDCVGTQTDIIWQLHISDHMCVWWSRQKGESYPMAFSRISSCFRCVCWPHIAVSPSDLVLSANLVPAWTRGWDTGHGLVITYFVLCGM